MRAAHESGEHGRVAHAGVEQPQRGWRGANLAQFFGRAVRDLLLLVAGVDEREIFLAIDVEAERRVAGHLTRSRCLSGALIVGHRSQPPPNYFAAARPAPRSRVMRVTCSPWYLHMSSSSALGMRISAPAPVIELAPYGVPPVTSRIVDRSL